jgi:hypothetical protein
MSASVDEGRGVDQPNRAVGGLAPFGELDTRRSTKRKEKMSS